jgi:hypothetical protein
MAKQKQILRRSAQDDKYLNKLATKFNLAANLFMLRRSRNALAA